MVNNLTKRLMVIVAMTAVAVVATLGFNFRTQTASADDANSQYEKMYDAATSQLGKPYSYGASGTNSFDCSSFTQYVYKQVDKNIARTAQAQYNTTKKVSKANRQKGDLVYFGSSKHSISHVGVYIGGGKMINAQNRGVIVERVNSPWWNSVGYSRP
ncbi:C40 family peptidase [Lactobacillaceae bacterium Scapto_B20]